MKPNPLSLTSRFIVPLLVAMVVVSPQHACPGRRARWPCGAEVLGRTGRNAAGSNRNSAVETRQASALGSLTVTPTRERVMPLVVHNVRLKLFCSAPQADGHKTPPHASTAHARAATGRPAAAAS